MSETIGGQDDIWDISTLLGTEVSGAASNSNWWVQNLYERMKQLSYRLKIKTAFEYPQILMDSIILPLKLMGFLEPI